MADLKATLSALKSTEVFAPFPPFADRQSWEALGKGTHKAPAESLIERGYKSLEQDIPALPVSLFLAYQREGVRLPYETPQIRRREMMGELALAYGLTENPVFIEKLEDLVWAILEESTWAWPAHCPPGLPVANEPALDLSATMTAFELAELCYLTGDLLPVEMRQRIHTEINQRVWAPFLQHDHGWMIERPGHPINNWAAVCVCGIIGSALYLETDGNRLAEIVARGLTPVAGYIDSFDADGGSAEGPGYWSYGFSYFVALAHMLSVKTKEKIDLLDNPDVADIARFPLRSRLSPGKFVNFSDSDEDLSFISGHIGYLSQHLDIPQLKSLVAEGLPPEQHAMRISWMLRDLTWQPEKQTKTDAPDKHDWFPELAWMVSRIQPENPRGFAVAVKGGHNGEMHNQNDIGSFLVHWQGQSLIPELGRGRYLKGYFGDERYTFLPARSLGHSVPIVNECEQGNGSKFKAVVISHTTTTDLDTLVLDMAKAYPQKAGLSELQRTISVERTPAPGAFTLTDQFAFSSGPGNFVSTIIALVDPVIDNGTVQLMGETGGLEITFDPELVELELITEPNIPFPRHDAPVHRLLFSPSKPTDRGTVSLRITPL